MKKSNLIICDLDGTLVDTCEANYFAYKQAAIDTGECFDQSIEIFKAESFGRHFSEFLPIVIPGITFDRMTRIARRKTEIYPSYFQRISLNTVLLEYIKSKKASSFIALCTTAQAINANTLLEHFSLVNFFDLILTREDVNKVKPDPECFIKALAYFKMDAKNAIVFEDSPAGFKAAEKAKISFVPVTFPFILG